MQLAGHLEQRLRRVVERHQLALQRIERLDLRARRLAGENALFDLFDLLGQRDRAPGNSDRRRCPSARRARRRARAAAAPAPARSGGARRRTPAARRGGPTRCTAGRRRSRPRRSAGRRRPARSRCSTTNSDEPYSSIFGRWWPFCASSMASSCRANSSCSAASSAGSGSFSATQTKQSRPGEMRSHLGQRNVGQLLPAIVGDAVDDHRIGGAIVVRSAAFAILRVVHVLIGDLQRLLRRPPGSSSVMPTENPHQTRTAGALHALGSRHRCAPGRRRRRGRGRPPGTRRRRSEPRDRRAGTIRSAPSQTSAGNRRRRHDHAGR